MNRRKFLIGSAALGVLSSLKFPSRALAADFTPPRFMISVLAFGGFDPLFFCNPSTNPNWNRISQGGVGSANGLRYATGGIPQGSLNNTEYAQLVDNATFFQRWGSHCTVFNGIQTGGVGHPTSRLKAMTGGGTVANPHPTLPALVGARWNANAPFGLLSTGGVEITQGLLPLVRGARARSVQDLVQVSGNLGNDIESKILQRAVQKAQRIGEDSDFASHRKSANNWETAFEQGESIGSFVVPTYGVPGDPVGTVASECEAAKVMLHAFSQGYAAAGNISVTGYDHHAEIDANHPIQIGELCALLDYIMAESERLGIHKDLAVYVTSDFGRTPGYSSTDDDAGKSHWPIGSVIVLSQAYPGGREIGSTDSEMRPIPVDMQSLQPSSSGVPLTTAIVHQAVRQLTGISDTMLDQRYELVGPSLPVFV